MMEYHLTSHDGYIFCSPAEKMLQHVTNLFDVLKDAFCKVHFDLIEESAIEALMLTMTIMRICETTKSEAPDESSMKGVTLRLLARPRY